MTSLEMLITHLRNQGVLDNPDLEKAFRTVDRADFIRKENAYSTYGDYPLPIGYGQTISQPFTVAFMLNLLNVKPGDSILDIGSGSGWTTALLAYLTGSRGDVLGLERYPELVAFGNRNLGMYAYPWARIDQSGPALGNPGEVYDRILVSASAARFPIQLLEQLKIGGILVMPVSHSIWKIIRTGEGFEREEIYGFTFVPLIYDE